MPFEIIEPTTKAAAPPVPPAEIHLSTRPKPGRGGGRMLVLRLGRKVAQDADIGPKRKVVLAWGTGPDGGKLRIGPPQAGAHGWPVRVNKAGTVYTITTGAIPDGFACEGDARPAAFELLPRLGAEPGPQIVVKLPASVWKKSLTAGDAG